jgi:hypothetical protein
LGRSWQFFLTIAIVIAAMSYFYYSSDFYAKRAAGEGGKTTATQAASAPSAGAPADPGAPDAPATPAAPSEGGIIPSNE